MVAMVEFAIGEQTALQSVNQRQNLSVIHVLPQKKNARRAICLTGVLRFCRKLMLPQRGGADQYFPPAIMFFTSSLTENACALAAV